MKKLFAGIYGNKLFTNLVFKVCQQGCKQVFNRKFN